MTVATLERQPDWHLLPPEMSVEEINHMIAMFLGQEEMPSLEAPAEPAYEGTELGDAVLVGNFIDGSPEWHEARSRGIGGSEISAILGINSWKSRYVLFLEKVGTIPPGDIDPDMAEWGHRLEPVLRKKFRDNHPEFNVVTAGSWRNKERSYQLFNPDGLLVDPSTGKVTGTLECKTSMQGYGWGPESDGEAGVPPKYVAQVRWGLDTFGLDEGRIIVLIGLGDYREYTIKADPYARDQARNEAAHFIDLVSKGEAPPIDGGKDTYEYLRTVNMSIDPKLTVDLTDEVAELWYAYKKAKDAYETAENLAKGHMLAHMGTAKAAKHNGKILCTRTAKGENAVPYILSK